MRKYIPVLVLLLTAFVFQANAQKNKKKPNVVFIFADDLGYGDLACYGHPYVETPNIDKLAKEGTKFNRFYATGVTCCPSRTGFMTSRHPASYQKYMAFYDFAGRKTITELLRDNGYVTGHVGKWHISGERKPANGTYGIDHINIVGDSKDETRGKDDDVFDAAIDFLDQHGKGDKPFYLNVWGHISHYKVDPHEKYPEHYKNLKVDYKDFDSHFHEKLDRTKTLVNDVDSAMRNYVGEVWSLDLAVGRLMKKLKELGIDKNTIVVFSSDQGPAPNKLTIGKEANPDPVIKGNMLGWAGGLRGGKHEQFEGGVRIPFIVRYPGHVPKNKVNKHTILSALDWLPTLCSITNTPYNKDDFEGVDASDIWFGSKKKTDRYLFWKVSAPGGAISVLHNNWKAHYNKKSKSYSLYDLDNDSGERNDVAQDNPEILKDLVAKVDKWNETLPTTYIKKDKSEKKGRQKNKKNKGKKKKKKEVVH